MGPTRRQILGIAGIAAACTAGAGAGVSLGLASKQSPAARPHGQPEPAGTFRPKALWHLRVPSDVLLTAAGAFVCAMSPNQNRLYLLHATDGSVRWELPGSWTIPVAGSGLVYAARNDGGLYAFSASSGNRQWNVPEASTAASGPLLDGTVLYTAGSVSGAAVILALDAQTGRKLWAAPAASGDLPIAAAAGTVCTSDEVTVRALNARSGAELWRWAAPAGSTLSPSPQVAHDVVYGGHTIYNSDGSVQFARSARDGTLLWSRTYPTPLIGMAAVGEIVYAAACSGNGGGLFAGTNPTLVSSTAIGNGTRVWTQSLPENAETFAVAGNTALLSVYPTPVAGGIAYPGGMASQTGLRALALNNGQARWSVVSAGWTLAAAPVITDDWVCASFMGESIRVVSLRTGATRWNLPTLAVSGPTVRNGMVFAAGADAMDYSGAISPEGTLFAVPI